MRRARARPSRRPTCRRTCATSSTRPASGRSRASTTGISSSPAASTSCRSSAAPAAWRRRVLGGWRANAIFIAQSGAPFTVNLSVDRANIGAGPAQRPDQLRDPNLPGGERTPERWFDTVGVRAAGAVHVRQRAAQQRHRPGLRERRLRAGQDVGAGRDLAARVPLGGLQPAQPRELRPAEPDLRQPELRPHLQREEPARDAVRRPARLLAIVAGAGFSRPFAIRRASRIGPTKAGPYVHRPAGAGRLRCQAAGYNIARPDAHVGKHPARRGRIRPAHDARRPSAQGRLRRRLGQSTGKRG